MGSTKVFNELTLYIFKSLLSSAHAASLNEPPLGYYLCQLPPSCDMQNIHKRALKKDNRVRTRVAFSHAMKQAAKQNI